MNFNAHCNLCDNFKTNFQDGVTCGLTNRKPAFNKICTNIKLSQESEKRLGLIHVEIERLKKRNMLIYIQFFLLTTLGCIIIIKTVFLTETTLEPNISQLKARLLITTIGFGLCSFIYSILYNHRKKTKIVKAKKRSIDNVLEKYQVKYSYHIVFGQKYHGNQDVSVELKSNNRLLKNSKIVYQI